MLLNIVVALLVAQVACGEELANLRGRSEATGKGLKADTTPTDRKDRAKSNEEFVSKIFNDLKKNLNSENARVAAAKSELDYYGGQGPKLSYGGYFVSRERKTTINSNWNDCSGQVETLVARNMACERTGEDRSAAYYCNDHNNGYMEIGMYEFSNQNCTGNIIRNSATGYNSCSWGYGMQCIPPSDNKVPAFTEKDGLTTYKFRYLYDCYNFASQHLGYYPYGTDDHPDFDDYYNPNYDDDHFDNCCTQYSIDEGCPFPLCNEGETEPPAPTERRLGAAAAASAAPQEAQAPAQATAKWWETQEFKDKLAAQLAKKAASPDATPAQKTDKAGKNGKAKSVEVVAQGPAVREYSLTQHRNDACLHDEKYDLWYKSACNGHQNTITYTLFVDEKCTKSVKRSEHYIYNVVPNYGNCVVSENGNGRTSLTVCHNNGGPSYAPRLALYP